jgi:hypothetical protein
VWVFVALIAAWWAAADESVYPRSAVLSRLRQASYGGNTGMASLSFGGPQTAFADDALAYPKSPIVTKAPLKAPEASRDVVFWARRHWSRCAIRRRARQRTVFAC